MNHKRTVTTYKHTKIAKLVAGLLVDPAIQVQTLGMENDMNVVHAGTLGCRYIRLNEKQQTGQKISQT